MSESSFEEEPAESLKDEKSEKAPSVVGTDNDGSTSNSDDRVITQEENKAVRRSKALVLSVIFLAALGCGVATYFFTKDEEEDDFENQFKDFASEVVAVAHTEAVSVFGMLGSLATTITSYTLDTGVIWPNITMPHFEQRGKKNNALSKALQVSLVPLITKSLKPQWEAFAVENQAWVQEGVNANPSLHEDALGPDLIVPPIPSQVFRFENGTSGPTEPQDGPGVEFGPGNYGVVWQQAPAPHDPSIINLDLLSLEVFRRIYNGMWETALPVLSEVTDLSFLYGGAIKDDITHPHSFLLQPIYPELDSKDTDKLLGFLVGVLPWDSYFQDLLPSQIKGIIVVLHNTCGEHYTYRLDGPEAVYLGPGDLHDRKYNYLEVTTKFAPFLDHKFSGSLEHCEYDLRLYPSADFEDDYKSDKPWIYALVVVAVFSFTAGVFILYDYIVQKRQNSVITKAKRTNAIVAALFPSNVRDRILKDVEEQAENELRENEKKKKFTFGASKDQLKTFLDEEENAATKPYSTKPIADLFPSATVMFADIVGFTAWSSVREPSQVFTLLETVYHSFDEIAKRRRVFKVETVGDCYVAVVGLPDPRPDHALVMARFAKECLVQMNNLTKKLEVQLGPDTGDLSMRIGLHSGPVTAGVLRGDKSRFQLFGDTVNTAARIEATGERNRIHLSDETAQILIKSNKSHWVSKRTDIVQAKGKGAMETYWLDTRLKSAPSVQSDGKGGSNNSGGRAAKNDAKFIQAGVNKPKPNEDEKLKRLIGWNTDVLGRLIKQIIARRNASVKLGKTEIQANHTPQLPPAPAGATVLDEVQEIIHLPAFDAVVVENQEDPNSIELDEEVTEQLGNLVGMIASLYRDNPFHNFEHASHVTMSVVKLLSRITTADALVEKVDDKDADAADLHDFTYGITSDPLTQFACVFAALIHDVDHLGVPNAQLIKEDTHLAHVYKNKSIAEQNSVDVSWELLFDDEFTALRSVVCATDDDLKRFRELVVNSVMATDIMDKDLKALRNARWEKAFSEEEVEESAEEAVNRKATIVIEHLIQASDVAHTMQHWHIYRKWNERLFLELYLAYRDGRAEKDPKEFWYKGEIGFFDFYIIPLAKKLKDCGVFGVSSDEYLNYAEKNRREWESKGQEVIEKMVQKVEVEYPMPVQDDTMKASMMRFQSNDMPLPTVSEAKSTTESLDDEPRSDLKLV